MVRRKKSDPDIDRNIVSAEELCEEIRSTHESPQSTLRGGDIKKIGKEVVFGKSKRASNLSQLEGDETGED